VTDAPSLFVMPETIPSRRQVKLNDKSTKIYGMQETMQNTRPAGSSVNECPVGRVLLSLRRHDRSPRPSGVRETARDTVEAVS
jgi:hypothetical protein